MEGTTAATTSKVSAKILRAMGIFSGVQSVGILCSVLRAKFIALCIGEAGVGLFAVFNSVIDMVSTSTQLNMRQSAVRDISLVPQSRIASIAGVVRWWGLRLGIAGAVLMLLLSPLLSLISFGDCSWWWSFAILSVCVLASAYINSEQALLQGTGRLRPLAKTAVTGAAGGTILSIPMYYLLGEMSIVPSLVIFSTVGAIAVRYYTDIRSVVNTRAYNVEQGKGFLRLGVYLTVSSVVTTVASYIFVSYITRTASIEATGLYQAGYTLVIRYTGIIFTALSMEYFPRITQISDRPRMASVVVSHEVSLILYVLTPMLVLFVALDQIAVLILYKESFVQMLPFVTIGIGAIVFRAVSYCMAYVIISRGDGRTYIVTEVLSSAVGLGLNITLFDVWGYAGLGLSYVLWYIIYTAIVWVVYHSYGMRLSTGSIRVLIISVLIVASAILSKHIGWWATLPALTVSATISIRGLRLLMRRARG